MARYLHQVLEVSRISQEFPYRCRFRTEISEALIRSVKTAGLIQPLIVSFGDKPELIAGHCRFAAAQKAGLSSVDVLSLQNPLPPQDLFLLSVYSNWNSHFSDLDQAYLLSQAIKQFSFSKKDVVEQIFPVLNLSQDSGAIEEAMEVMALNPELLELIALDQLSFRGIRTLSRFSASEQSQFALLAKRAGFTSNQIMKLTEWIFDLMKLKQQTFSQVLEAAGSGKILSSSSDRKSKGERIFEAVAQLRFPNVRERMARFEAAAAQLGDKSGISLEAPAYLEAQGYTLKARIKDGQSLEQLRGVIEEKRKVLNSLLDIVL